MNFDLEVKPSQYFSVVREEMLKYVPDNAKIILEIGCGDGNFGELLLKKGAKEVWGIEYDSHQGAIAGSKITKVLIGDVLDQLVYLSDNYFDVIVCNDVIEHLIDPYKVLVELTKKLKSDGIMVSSIPNIRYFRQLIDFVFYKNWDYTDNGIMDKTHFRFFTFKSIRKMFENCGYEVIKMEGINATKSIRPFIVNLIFFGGFWDIKYLQFATVAKKKND